MKGNAQNPAVTSQHHRSAAHGAASALLPTPARFHPDSPREISLPFPSGSCPVPELGGTRVCPVQGTCSGRGFGELEAFQARAPSRRGMLQMWGTSCSPGGDSPAVPRPPERLQKPKGGHTLNSKPSSADLPRWFPVSTTLG